MNTVYFQSPFEILNNYNVLLKKQARKFVLK